MAKNAENKYAALITTGLVALILGGLIGAFAFPVEKEVDMSQYVPAEDFAALKLDYEGVSEQVTALNDSYNELQSKYDELLNKFADEIREDEILEIAKEAVEDKYIKKLDFDEEEYEDYYFKIAWAGSDIDLDKDSGDAEVELHFVVMQYDEDTNDLVGMYPATATMEVEDDNDVDDLKIELEEVPE